MCIRDRGTTGANSSLEIKGHDNSAWFRGVVAFNNNIGGTNWEVASTGAANFANTGFEINSSGIVTAGEWEGTAIGVPYGGTGDTTLTQHAVLLGACLLYTSRCV